MPSAKRNSNFECLGHSVAPGERLDFEVPISRLFGHAQLSMPVTIHHGREPGPALLLTAAIHGDELNGVEIIRRVLANRWWRSLKGTVIAIPVVNVFGVVDRTRYLPDRRDLNRMFPGSPHGPLAARLAYLISTEVLPHVHHAVDLHTGAVHRSNLPQIRVHLENPEARRLAEAFAAPVMVQAPIRDGSMRGAGDDLGVAVITYEGGEALRFDEIAIRTGVVGVRNVLRALGMLAPGKSRRNPASAIAKASLWVRATADGFFRPAVRLGRQVSQGDVLGYIAGPLEPVGTVITAPASGIVIGCNNLPLVLEGEALLHLAVFDELDEAAQTVVQFHAELERQLAGVVDDPGTDT